jgi:selenocysteine lyase/cysteine desulfurase
MTSASAPPSDRLSIDEARLQFSVEPGYLDTASVGAPPGSAVQAMRDILELWQKGRARAQDFDRYVEATRATFARLVGVDGDNVCVGSQVSALVGLVASSLGEGARVVAVEGDFTSILFPFLAQAPRGVDVTLVPLAALADSIEDETDLVVVSSVQSSSGEVAELGAIVEAASAHDAETLVDVTQSCGWMPLEVGRFDYSVCAAYKWLLSPRGTAFMTVRPDRLDRIHPSAASWYAGEDIWSSIYGGPLRLASTARRLDVSPAWFSWVGAEPSLELLEAVGIATIHDHNVALANRFRDGLGMQSSNTAIVSVPVDGATERLNAAGLRASSRAGAARLSFHLYNTPDDVDRAIAALR